MKNKLILKKWIGKIIVLCNISDETQKLFLLKEIDKNGILIETSFRDEIYIFKATISMIILSDKGGIEKFYSYREKRDLNPDFEGDCKEDKGYTTIKKKRKSENESYY